MLHWTGTKVQILTQRCASAAASIFYRAPPAFLSTRSISGTTASPQSSRCVSICTFVPVKQVLLYQESTRFLGRRPRRGAAGTQFNDFTSTTVLALLVQKYARFLGRRPRRGAAGASVFVRLYQESKYFCTRKESQYLQEAALYFRAIACQLHEAPRSYSRYLLY